MWGQLAFAVAAGAVFLYAPGYLALRAVPFARAAAFACAPLVTMLVYPVLCIAYEALGVFTSWVPLFVVALAACAAVWALSHALRAFRRCSEENDRSARAAVLSFRAEGLPARLLPWVDGALLALYLLVGLAVGCIVFVSALSGPDAIFQWFDNVHHLSQVRNYLDSGMWSPLDSFMYKAPLGTEAFDPYGGGSFYPSTWHCVTAMMAGAAGASVPVATNAAVLLLSCIVFPASTFALLRSVFPGRVDVVAAGSACAMVCGVFPWGFVIAGPLYPNLAAMAIVPALAALFIETFRHGACLRARATCAAAFVIGLLALAFAHPNAPFSLAVLLIPYCAFQMPRIARHLPLKTARARSIAAVALVAAFLLVAAALWYALYCAPPLREVVSYRWDAFKSPFWGVVDALFGNYRESSPNYLLGVCIVIGVVSAVRNRESAWAVASYAFAVIIYAVAASTDGPVKQLLAGFWYTDFYRLGATAFVCSLPLAALGLATLCRGVAYACAHGARLRAKGDAVRLDLDAVRRARWVLAACAFAACVVLWCVPWRPYVSFFVGSDQARSQLCIVSQRVWSQYSYRLPAIYDEEERAFVRDVIELIGTEEMVINEPNDGTMFAYGADGLNAMFRYMYGEGTTPEATAIRIHLDQISCNETVREAVKDSGARYVIQLDHGQQGRTGYYMFSYQRSEWVGIDGISDFTEGFDVVLSRGDMRLYRIVGLDDA